MSLVRRSHRIAVALGACAAGLLLCGITYALAGPTVIVKDTDLLEPLADGVVATSDSVTCAPPFPGADEVCSRTMVVSSPGRSAREVTDLLAATYRDRGFGLYEADFGGVRTYTGMLGDCGPSIYFGAAPMANGRALSADELATLAAGGSPGAFVPSGNPTRSIPLDQTTTTLDPSTLGPSTPTVSTPDVSTPDVSTPDVSTPDVSTPGVTSGVTSTVPAIPDTSVGGAVLSDDGSGRVTTPSSSAGSGQVMTATPGLSTDQVSIALTGLPTTSCR